MHSKHYTSNLLVEGALDERGLRDVAEPHQLVPQRLLLSLAHYLERETVLVHKTLETEEERHSKIKLIRLVS